MSAPASRATGVALPGWRGAALVVESLWTWYRRNWRATIVSSLLQPVLFLLAFGVGFGTLLTTGGRTPALPGGASYLEYVAPALLAVSAIQIGTGESTYPVLSGFKWQRTFWGMSATPITPDQIAAGQLAWIAARILSTGAVYVLVLLVFGAVTSPGIVLSLLAATLCGLGFASLLTAFSASLTTDGAAFNAVFRFVLLPMTLFSGTFFPVSALPGFLQPVAWALPLWHGVELSRGAALGTGTPLASAGHLAYLVAVLAVGLVLTRWRFRLRLRT